MEDVAAQYDNEIISLNQRIADLKANNLSLKAEQKNLQNDRRELKKDSKEMKKTDKEDIKGIVEAQKKIMEYARQGDEEGLENAKEDYKKLIETQQLNKDGFINKWANINKSYKENKQTIKDNKEEIKKLENKIKELTKTKSEELKSITEIKDKDIAEIKKENPLMARIKMFLARTTLNTSKVLNDKVFMPVQKKIEEKVPEIGKAIKEKVTSKATDVKEHAKSIKEHALGIWPKIKNGAITKLENYIENGENCRNNLMNELGMIDKNKYNGNNGRE